MGDSEAGRQPEHTGDPETDIEAPSAQRTPGPDPNEDDELSADALRDPDLRELILIRKEVLGIKNAEMLLERARQGGHPIKEDTWYRMAGTRWINRGPDGRITSNWPTSKTLYGIAAALGVDVLQVSRAVELSLEIRVRTVEVQTPDDEATTMAILTFRESSPVLRQILRDVVKDVARRWPTGHPDDEQQRSAGAE